MVDFLLYIHLNETHWSIYEAESMFLKLLELISKYSKYRKHIYVDHDSVNISFVHTLVKRLSKMNQYIKYMLETVSKRNLINTKYIYEYLNSSYYMECKDYILSLFVKHLHTPVLANIYMSNVIIYDFINVISDSLFSFTPTHLSQYYTANYKLKQHKYKYYISNNHSMLDKFDAIYNKLISLDKTNGHYLCDDYTTFIKSNTYNMTHDNIYFKPTYLNNCEYINSTHTALNSLSTLSSEINKHLVHLSSQEENSYKNHELPDMFLDPIMKTEIMDPVLLPNCDVIMDRSILEQMLLHNNINPFTQDKLNITEINDFNNTPDAIIRVDTFNSDKQNWILEHTDKK